MESSPINKICLYIPSLDMNLRVKVEVTLVTFHVCRVNGPGLTETTQSHWCAFKSTGDFTLILFLAISPAHTQRNNYNLNSQVQDQAADLIHYTLGLHSPVTNDIIVEKSSDSTRVKRRGKKSSDD